MSELLCPAGTIEAFHAAISNGADAIYLGLDKFSARAYAENFNIDNLRELVKFAHLRNVKIYVTVNTIVYDYELEEVYKTIDELAAISVDGVIVQDLAVLTYVTEHYKSMQASASTQCGIEDEDGVALVQDLGVERVVFARETPVARLKEIKEHTNIEVEAFIHGALCVSYSGNCLMSSMIGERSGNRGRCAGCCRKRYTLIDTNTKEKVASGYLLSMKDLNVASKIDDLRFADSLKIEGRMKDPAYVAGVTRLYRRLLDGEKIDFNDFNKIFNRTYTLGFSNGETAATITNIERPNNNGYLIGTIEKVHGSKIWIRLTSKIGKGDQLRIEIPGVDKEISIPVTKMFDYNGNEVESAVKCVVTYCDYYVKAGAKVFKTKDAEFVKKAEEDCRSSEYRKLPVDMEFSAHIGEALSLKVKYQSYEASVSSEFIVQESKTSSVTSENIQKQLGKLNDTPYSLGNLKISKDEAIFVPLKAINELRRLAIESLNQKRLFRETIAGKKIEINPKKYEAQKPELTVEVVNDEQYAVAKELGINHIYYKNVVRRNNCHYVEDNGEVLVGGLGGIHHYAGKNPIVTDYSFNTVNAKSVALLSTLGAERITLSQEISRENIETLIYNYERDYGTHPNLELIVYGRAKVMHSRYCPLKRLGKCGDCRKSNFVLKDEFASFPIKFNEDCTTTIYNSKTLNIIDDLDTIHGVNYFRLSFSTESPDEVRKVIEGYQLKINSGYSGLHFDKATDTHGHFLKNPL